MDAYQNVPDWQPRHQGREQDLEEAEQQASSPRERIRRSPSPEYADTMLHQLTVNATQRAESLPPNLDDLQEKLRRLHLRKEEISKIAQCGEQDKKEALLEKARGVLRAQENERQRLEKAADEVDQAGSKTREIEELRQNLAEATDKANRLDGKTKKVDELQRKVAMYTSAIRDLDGVAALYQAEVGSDSTHPASPRQWH